MSAAAEILQECRRLGLRLSVHGDKLRIEPAHRVMSGLLQALKDEKPRLLKALSLEDAATKACQGLGNLTGAQYLAFLSPEDREDYLAGRFPVQSFRAHAIARSETLWREQGIAPPWWTARAHCDQCGPILMPEPVHVPNCIWCWNRRHHVRIPRPTVAA